MDWLFDFVQQGLSFLIPMTILLGLLIFVHEMGHFPCGQVYKVRVEVFSLGFGKKIFQFQYGETTYCVCLIPLGGYVKMFGDEISAEISEEQKQVAFLHKPVGQRIAIVLAGPLMNFFFAIVFVFCHCFGRGRDDPTCGRGCGHPVFGLATGISSRGYDPCGQWPIHEDLE